MSSVHKRRPRYAGKHPRRFHEKYKELDPGRYAGEVEKVLAAGKTPAGMHRPIMVSEVVACLDPKPGETAVDCTLGGGGHAQALLERLRPSGRLIGLDVDPLELPRTEQRLRDAGIGPEEFVARLSNFAGVPKVLAALHLPAAQIIVADLGVSSMQLDNPDRGFSHKASGPLDMRMNPKRGETAAALVARSSTADLTTVLEDNADEPYADFIAGVLQQCVREGEGSTPSAVTASMVASRLRAALMQAVPRMTEDDAARSVRRTFQALRVAVNDEFSSLDALLRVLPTCLAPGGRVAILTFHSGEDRRVKKAFQAGAREGVYSYIADEVIRATPEERRANPRASSAKLRWAVRAS